MTQVHAVVWLDHREAHIAAFSLGKSSVIEIHSDLGGRRIHRKSRQIGSGKAADDHHYFDEIASALHDIRLVLLVGPGNAKTALLTFLESRHPEAALKVVGVETMDHPTDGQLLAHARSYFAAADQLET